MRACYQYKNCPNVMSHCWRLISYSIYRNKYKVSRFLFSYITFITGHVTCLSRLKTSIRSHIYLAKSLKWCAVDRKIHIPFILWNSYNAHVPWCWCWRNVFNFINFTWKLIYLTVQSCIYFDFLFFFFLHYGNHVMTLSLALGQCKGPFSVL